MDNTLIINPENKAVGPGSPLLILGLFATSLLGLIGISFFNFLVLGSEGQLFNLPFLSVPLVFFIVTGSVYGLLRNKLYSISRHQSIYEWIFLIVGGGVGIFVYYYWLSLTISSNVISNLFSLFDSIFFFGLIFIISFGYIANFFVRTLALGWSTGNLGIFIRKESLVSVLLLIIFLAFPISLNISQVSGKQRTLSKVELSNFQDLLVQDPTGQVKKLVITADLSVPESGFYTLNNNLYNKEIPEVYDPYSYLNYAPMSVDGKEYSGNFYEVNLSDGVHKVQFDRNFKDYFEFSNGTGFEKNVANRKVYMQVLIWKGKQGEKSPGEKPAEFKYETKLYSSEDYKQ